MTSAAAFFDVDGTLVDRHIVHQFLYIRRRMLPRLVRPLWTGAFMAKMPYYLALDKLSRTRLNTVFYRNYGGLDCRTVRSLAEDCFEQVIRPNIFGEVRDCFAEHRAAGRRLVLVTGSIDFIMAPLVRHLGASDCMAPTLETNNGRFTGELDGPPVGSAEKARRIRDYAEAKGIDLSSSHAYGDSIADVPMLECVGHPHAVNPDWSLASTARRQGWPIHDWSVRGRGGVTGRDTKEAAVR